MRGKKFTGFVTREQALADLFAAWTPVPEEELAALDEAAGRVTARELFSENTLPVYRVSGCDGIAVQAARFADGMPDYTQWREGVEFVRADTGDDFPDAYDAVIMIEEVDFSADGQISQISGDLTVRPGDNVTPAGSSVRKGDRLIGAGAVLRPTDLAALAMGGQRMVPVRKRPVVAFIPTGSELVPATVKPVRGQNVDTNSILIRETLRALGAQVVTFPIIPDDNDLLEKTLCDALGAADIVVINGGTAKGSEDFNTALIGRKGVLLHHYVAAAPGRPMALGMIDGKPVINLPGPTMAAFYGADWCLTPIVCRALGVPVPKKETVTCRLEEGLSTGPAMAILCRLEVERDGQTLTARPKSFRSGSLPACLTSNAMYVSPVGESARKAGEEIEAQLLRGRETLE